MSSNHKAVMLASLAIALAIVPAASAAETTQAGPGGDCSGTVDALCVDDYYCPPGAVCLPPEYCAVYVDGRCEAALGPGGSAIVRMVLRLIP